MRGVFSRPDVLGSGLTFNIDLSEHFYLNALQLDPTCHTCACLKAIETMNFKKRIDMSFIRHSLLGGLGGRREGVRKNGVDSWTPIKFTAFNRTFFEVLTIIFSLSISLENLSYVAFVYNSSETKITMSEPVEQRFFSFLVDLQFMI